MKTEIIQKNRGETTQRTLWFFGTAPSQKTPRTRITPNFKLYTLNFKLPQVSSRLVVFTLLSLLYTLNCSTTYALRTISVAPTVSNINSGLVGYWTFDGKNLTNATATNSAGTSYDGALTNMTATSSKVIGKIGQALTFNGSNQYVNVGNNPLVGATKFTYSSWIKVSTSDFAGAFKTLMDDATGDANVNNGMVIGVDDRGGASPTAGITAMFHTATGCTLVYSSNIFSSTSQWYHITLAYNGVSTPTLYVNGISKSYTTGVCSSGSGSYVPRSANMWLGAVNNGTFYFKGTMDDVRIYNRAISANEVQTLYKMGGSAVKAAPPNAGPISYWSFDNKYLTSATATDQGTGGNNGTLIGSPTVGVGKNGQALSFNGSSQYVQVKTSAVISTQTTSSVSAWIKMPAGYSASGSAIYSENIGSGVVYTLYVTSAGKLDFYIFNGPNNDAISTASVNDGNWHHVVSTFGAGGMKTYIDGVQDGSNVNTTVASPTVVQTRIGMITNAGIPFYFPGLIDDVRIYNRTLSASEIQALYNYKNETTKASYGATVSSTVPVSSGLVGYWTFDGKNLTNATATDSSGSGNDGAASGARVTTVGKVGQALSFNGSNFYINLRNSPTGISGDASFTECAWFKTTSASTPQAILMIGDETLTARAASLYIGLGSGTITTAFAGLKNYTSTTGLISANTWYHFCATKTPGPINTTTTMYLNGAVVAAASAPSDTPNINPARGEIGRFGPGGLSYFSGQIDDARVYNRAISAKEILTLYKMGAR